MTNVLDGIRVLDFGRYIAGPYCAALLADLGADVIRIERIGGGEDRWVAPINADGIGALYVTMNRNKRGMTLDPMRPEGREVVARLVKSADVVVANLPPQTLEAMKLDYASLSAVKPDIILTTVTAYGRGGPYSERVGFDGIGQVMSGAVYMTGTEDQPGAERGPMDASRTPRFAGPPTFALLPRRDEVGRRDSCGLGRRRRALDRLRRDLVRWRVGGSWRLGIRLVAFGLSHESAPDWFSPIGNHPGLRIGYFCRRGREQE